jgi:hypothetical protein
MAHKFIKQDNSRRIISEQLTLPSIRPLEHATDQDFRVR